MVSRPHAITHTNWRENWMFAHVFRDFGSEIAYAREFLSDSTQDGLEKRDAGVRDELFVVVVRITQYNRDVPSFNWSHDICWL